MNAVEDALENSATLIKSGDWGGALRSLADAHRTQPDPQLARALADLRHRSWPYLTTADPRPQPTPSAESIPLGPSGLPEASLAGLTAADLRAALLTHGTLYIPRALDGNQVASLTATIDSAIEAAQAHDRDDEPTTGDTSDGPVWRPLELDRECLDAVSGDVVPLHRKFIHEAGGVLLADAPGPMAQLLQLYESLGLHELLSDFLGDRPAMSAQKCTLRRVEPTRMGQWHQDGAFLGSHIRAINIWVPLTSCGTDAPGLDIINQRLDHIVETGTRGSYFKWAVGDDVVTDIVGPEGFVRPTFEAGDMLIFDEMMLHRTAITPTMTGTRHAVEFWCFAMSTYPEGHIPLVW